MVHDTHPDLLALELHRTGDLDGESSSEVDVHLDGCAPCRAVSRELVDAAKELGAPGLEIPSELAAAIRKQGRRAAARGQSRRVWGKRARWMVPAAAAAALLIAVAPWRIEQPAHPAEITDVRDLNGDGSIDVLDALVLARAVERGTASASWDLNRDTHIDRRDAEMIALAAVSMGAQR